MKILGEKTLLDLPVQSILKWLIEIKKLYKILFSHFFLMTQKVLIFLRHQKKCENKKLRHFFSYYIGTTRVHTDANLLSTKMFLLTFAL